MQNEGGTIFSKKSEFYVRKNIDFVSFSQYFGDCCRHIGSWMRGVVCNFFWRGCRYKVSGMVEGGDGQLKKLGCGDGWPIIMGWGKWMTKKWGRRWRWATECRSTLYALPPPSGCLWHLSLKNILCSIKFSFLEVISIHFNVLTYICMSYITVKHKNIQCCYLLWKITNFRSRAPASSKF